MSWDAEGIHYEPDQTHADIIIKQLGLDNKKAVNTPGSKADNEKDEENDAVDLEPKFASMYRAITARANYLSQDRSDIKFAVKELSRHMARPCRRHWRKIIRLGKYLIGKQRFVCDYEYQEKYNKIDVWTDTDYAGCRETRKSTSGGVVLLGNILSSAGPQPRR